MSTRERLLIARAHRCLSTNEDSAMITSHQITKSQIKRAPVSRLTGDEVVELVNAAAAGDQLARERLFDEFAGLVRAAARAYRLSEADAADVAQVTWLRLLEHLDDLNEPARVGAWLATTARRECLRVLNRARRHVPLGDDPPDHEPPESPPDNSLLIAERDQALWRSFARLRATDQALLRLLLADPRPPYEEISATLNMPIGSIGPTRARALDRLRRELDGEGTLALLTA